MMTAVGNREAHSFYLRSTDTQTEKMNTYKYIGNLKTRHTITTRMTRMKSLTTLKVKEDVEQIQLSYIAGENIK